MAKAKPGKTPMYPLKRKQLDALWGMLLHPAPPPEGSAGKDFLYYAFNSRPRRFIESEEPLPLEDILKQPLIPETLAARVKAALAAFAPQETGVPSPMIWTTPPEGSRREGDRGELIVWYASVGLWGSTAYHLREGKGGTIFARTPEPLIALALAQQLLPRPDLASPTLMARLGMQEIVPLLLDDTALTPLADCICQLGMQAASESSPCWKHPSQEWLVSLLYKDRNFAGLHQSKNLPTIDAVIWRLLVLRRMLACCSGEKEWEQLYAQTRDPYDVCQRRIQEFEEFCDPESLAALENAFATQLSRLERVAQRAASHPFFIAHTLARYQEKHRLSEVQLAQQLGGAVEDLCRLRLCLMPTSDHCDADVQTIATHTQMYAGSLAHLLCEEKGKEQ